MAIKNLRLKLIIGLAVMFALTFIIATKQMNVHYVALGDSLAFGMGGTRDTGYVDYFYSQLKKERPYARLTNLGQNGDTSDDLLQTVAQNQEELTKADIITLDIGANDLFVALDSGGSEKTMAAAFDHYEDNLTQIFRELQKLNHRATILAMDYYNPHPQDLVFERQIQELNRRIRKVAVWFSVPVAPVYEAYAGTGIKYLIKPNYNEDPVHPNDLGYQVIGEEFWNIYQKR